MARVETYQSCALGRCAAGRPLLQACLCLAREVSRSGCSHLYMILWLGIYESVAPRAPTGHLRDGQTLWKPCSVYRGAITARRLPRHTWRCKR